MPDRTRTGTSSQSAGHPAGDVIRQDTLHKGPVLVLVADSARARLFEYAGGRLQELADFVHGEGRARDRELVTDEQGRLFSRGATGTPRAGGRKAPGHSAGPDQSPAEHESELFARRLLQKLEALRNDAPDKPFGALVLVAPPRFLGRLRALMHRELAQHVLLALDKDLTHAGSDEIRHQLEAGLRPAAAATTRDSGPAGSQ